MLKKSFTNHLHWVLLLVWLLIVGWSVLGYINFKDENQQRLESKAKDYTIFLQVALNAQAWNGFYPQMAMMALLNDLVSYTELQGVILIDGAGKRILQTGVDCDYTENELIENKIIWSDENKRGYFTNLATLPQGYFTAHHLRRQEKISEKEIDRRIEMYLEKFNCKPRCSQVDEFMTKQSLSKTDIDRFIEQLFGKNQPPQVRYIFHKELEGQKLTPMKLLDLMNVLSLFKEGGKTPPPPPQHVRTGRGSSNLNKVDISYFTIVLSQAYELELINADFINRIRFNLVSLIILILIAISWRNLRHNAELRGRIMVMESKSEALKDLNMA
ncbi:MAG: hypothetical protein ACRC37_06195, partial [Lentisphaeria bacterium]